MVQDFAPGAALEEIRNNGEKYDTEICENMLYNYIYHGDVFLFLTRAATRSKKKPPKCPAGKTLKSARKKSSAGAALTTGKRRAP